MAGLRGRRLILLGVAGLLVVLMAELTLSSRQMSKTIDEGAHLYAGYRHWRLRDFGVNPEHPPLVKMVAALPLLGMQLRQPHPPNPFFLVEEYAGGEQLMQANNADVLLTRSRLAVSVFTVLLGLLIFVAGYEMFGPEVGLIGLVLFTFEPTVLAHGALVTTDMGLATFMFAAVYAFSRYVKQPGAGRLIVLGLMVGLALVTKMSGVLVFPILLLCAAAELVRRWDARRALRLVGAIAVAAVIGYVMLWGFYGFRYAARPASLVMMPALSQFAAMLSSPAEASVVMCLAHWHLLPEAYLYGWTKLPAGVTRVPTFLFGRLYDRGVWFYFPAALLIKSSLTLLLLLAVTPILLLRRKLPVRREVVFLGAAAVVFLGASMTSDLNIGVRHVLPVYPFMAVLAGASAWAVAKTSHIARLVVGAALLFQAASSLHTYPSYLPYANEAFGGPNRTYKLLTDSNVDWAQSLKQVKSYLGERDIRECWIAHSGVWDDLAAAGIPCKRLPTGLALMAGVPQAITPPRISGVVLIGAIDASGVLWGDGDRNPYRQFQDGKPEAMIGSSVLVYRGDYDVSLLAAQSHYSQVAGLLMRGMQDQALTEAREAVALAPNSAEVRAELGGTLRMVHQEAESDVRFAEAMSLARTHQPNDESQRVEKMIARFERPAF